MHLCMNWRQTRQDLELLEVESARAVHELALWNDCFCSSDGRYVQRQYYRDQVCLAVILYTGIHGCMGSFVYVHQVHNTCLATCLDALQKSGTYYNGN